MNCNCWKRKYCCLDRTSNLWATFRKMFIISIILLS